MRFPYHWLGTKNSLKIQKHSLNLSEVSIQYPYNISISALMYYVLVVYYDETQTCLPYVEYAKWLCPVGHFICVDNTFVQGFFHDQWKVLHADSCWHVSDIAWLMSINTINWPSWPFPLQHVSISNKLLRRIQKCYSFLGWKLWFQNLL